MIGQIKHAGIVLAVFSCVCGIMLSTAARAQNLATPWQSGTPLLQTLSTFAAPTGQTDRPEIDGNRPQCVKRSFITRPESKVGPYTSYAEIRQEVCTRQVPGAELSTSGHLLTNGTITAGKLVGPAAYAPNYPFVAVPGQNTILQTGPSPSYVKLRFIDTPFDGLISEKSSNGEITYRVIRLGDTYMRNANNSDMMFNISTVSFSANGQWLVTDAPGTGVVRINTIDRQQVVYAPSYTYIDDNIQTAISDDGRFAALAFRGPTFRVYDLGSCQKSSGLVQNCVFRDMMPVMTTKYPGMKGHPTALRFEGQTLSFNILQSNGQMARVQAVPEGDTLSNLDGPLRYLAMGDSYASGEGALAYRPETATKDNRCHVSTASYPHVLGQQLANTLEYPSIACSGAKIKDVITANATEYESQDPQASGKSFTNNISTENTIFNQYLPGYRGQINYLSIKQPSSVTISVGGNDIGFGSIVKACVVTPWSCYQTYNERLGLYNTINSQYPRLVDVYTKLKTEGSQRRVYVIGYPQVIKPGGACAANIHFSSEEAVFSSQLIDYLNQVVRSAAEAAGVYYVDVEDIFDGSRLCEGSPSTQAVNGLLANKLEQIRLALLMSQLYLSPEKYSAMEQIRTMQLFQSESYHPNAFGHTLYAQRILSATDNLTKAMPKPAGSPWIAPKPTAISLFNGFSPPEKPEPVYYDDIVGDLLLKNADASLKVQGEPYAIKPNSNVSITIYSTPTLVGQVKTDSTGNIDEIIHIPESLEPGVHTIKLSATNIQGDPIIIQKVLFVAQSMSDFDGDGVSNDAEQCLVVEPAGVDVDKDGVDDACDGDIGPPPPDPEPQPEPTPDPTPAPDTSSTPTPEPTPLPSTPPNDTSTQLAVKEPLQGAGETVWSSPLTISQAATVSEFVTSVSTTRGETSSNNPLPQTSNSSANEDSVVPTDASSPSTSVAGTSDAAQVSENPALTIVRNDPLAWIAALVAMGILAAFGLYRLTRKA